MVLTGCQLVNLDLPSRENPGTVFSKLVVSCKMQMQSSCWKANCGFHTLVVQVLGSGWVYAFGNGQCH